MVFSIVVQNHTHTERGTSSYEYGPPLPARPLDRAVALVDGTYLCMKIKRGLYSWPRARPVDLAVPRAPLLLLGILSVVSTSNEGYNLGHGPAGSIVPPLSLIIFATDSSYMAYDSYVRIMRVPVKKSVLNAVLL